MSDNRPPLAISADRSDGPFRSPMGRARLALGLSLLILVTAAAPQLAVQAGTPVTPTAPQAPATLRAAAGNAVVHLSWTAPGGAPAMVAGYSVYRWSDAPDTARLLATLAPDATTYTDYEVDNLRTYTYTVRALGDGKVDSPQAAPVTATPVARDLHLTLWPGRSTALVDGVAVALDAPAELRQGTALVPLRFVATALGATVGYDGRRREITATLGGRTVRLWLAKTTAEVDGRRVAIATPPVLERGHALVPLRLVAEAFGAAVGYDPADRRISVSLADTDGSPELATTLAVGRPLAGALNGTGDVDVFRSAVGAGRTFRAAVTGAEACPALVLSLMTLGGEGASPLLRSVGERFPGSRTAELETMTGPDETLLYLRVQAADPRQGGPGGFYTLTVEETTEPQDSPAGALHLVVDGEAFPGELHSACEADYYCFEATGGRVYAAWVVAGATAPASPPVAVRADLLGPDGTVLLCHDRTDGLPAGDGPEPQLLWKCPTGGRYVLSVASLDGGWGTYSVRVTSGPSPPPGGPRTAEVLLPDHDARPGWLSSAGDENWYAFAGRSGERYFVQTLGLTQGCDTVLSLHGQAGQELAVNDDGLGRVWPDAGSLIVWTAAYDGLFYVRVKAWSPPDGGPAGLGRYTVTVTRTGPETNERPSRATRLSGPGQWPNSLVDGDRDWFCFEVRAGQDYVLETRDLSPGCDTDLAVYDQDWRLLAANDDWTDAPGADVLAPADRPEDSLASRVRFRPTSSARVYACVTAVEVRGSHRGTGLYTLALRLCDPDRR